MLPRNSIAIATIQELTRIVVLFEIEWIPVVNNRKF